MFSLMECQPFHSESESHVDGGHHRDGVEWKQEVGDEEQVEPEEEEENKEKMVTAKLGLQAKLPDGLKQHGDKVDKVAASQDRQKLRGFGE